MKVGYAQEMITPSLERPVYLAGFGNNRQAESVHDELTVRALSIQTGATSLCLCALDLIGFFRADVQDVIRQVHEVQPDLQVVIASTHTHHGPDTLGLWGPNRKTSGVDAVYMRKLKREIVATILSSLEHHKPAELKTASVHVPGVAKNNRDPKIIDDELTLVSFEGPERQTLATVAIFPCHPEVLWEMNPQITADYPGYLRDEIERITGAPCIFFSGALGGMMTPDVQDHSFAEAEAMGKKLAKEGLAALERAKPQPAPIFIQMEKKELQVRLTNILYKIAFRRKLLPDARDRGQLTSEVNLIRLGDLWLASVPGELLPRLGLTLKQELREAGAGLAGVIGLANDELGYILPERDFRYPLNPFNPGKHYEETNSVGKEVGPKVMQAVRSLLNRS